MAQLFALENPYDEALRWITETLKRVNLQVATSFDLRETRTAYTNCPCPHHGTAACDCQIVVLLVYGADGSPATLLVHSSDGRTWLSLTDYPGQRPSPSLRAAILTALSPDTSPFHPHE
ncbi:MAG: hypothetical protein WA996_15245 [Candidatus Promineifilaceae bacterium]